MLSPFHIYFFCFFPLDFPLFSCTIRTLLYLIVLSLRVHWHPKISITVCHFSFEIVQFFFKFLFFCFIMILIVFSISSFSVPPSSCCFWYSLCPLCLSSKNGLCLSLVSLVSSFHALFPVMMSCLSLSPTCAKIYNSFRSCKNLEHQISHHFFFMTVFAISSVTIPPPP